MSAELLAAGAMIVALTFYALLGGADYGGGVWDLFAAGERASKQRALIADAIGPVWEANHVWLILVVVILFTGFPPAFAGIATALHIPLTLMLIGVVLRGAAFTFRTYDVQRDDAQRRWSYVFSVASIFTPILLGLTLGAIASGAIKIENGQVAGGFVRSWLAPFPLAVGCFALALFAFLAAVYLTLETNDTALQDDFRKRALAAGVVVGGLALLVFLLSGAGAPSVRAGLTRSVWAWPLHAATALCAVGAFWSLWRRAYRWARWCAAGQVALILWGWALAQFPYIVEPDITIHSAAAPHATLRLLVVALGLGALLLFPSFYYLFRIFKSK
ncbi:MAG: cytochrome bd ubiquinol oxidase subunit [Blastocatellia bacterium]|nr:cytochrome bd ubiquinol oxidase subunit [Blastocatellia bacterium]